MMRQASGQARRAWCVLLTACLVICGSSPARAEPAEPLVTAQAAVLLDYETGKMLWARNAEEHRPPASITKIMTALVAIERGNLEDMVKVSRRAAGVGGSSLEIAAGQVFSLRQLLYGTLLESGNDAATAVAEHVAGDVERFVDLMNRKAAELGLYHTRFRNPHGLSDVGHFSTAYDLAMLSSYALKNPIFASMVATRQREVRDAGWNVVLNLKNTNRLLWSYEWAEGVKTGTTPAAGECLAAAATKEGHRLISVVLKSRDRWGDSIRLLEYGFSNFDRVAPLREGEIWQTVRVKGGNKLRVPLRAESDLAAVVPEGTTGLVELVSEVASPIEAPLDEGQPVGALYLHHMGKPLAFARLVAAEPVEQKFRERIRKWIGKLLGGR